MDFSAGLRARAPQGPGRWNGVAIASRIRISGVVAGIPTPDGWTDDSGRFLAATCGPMQVATICIPNGRVVGSEFYLEKLEWLARLSVCRPADPDTELAICGSYNVALEDIDVWDINAVHGATVSPRARPSQASGVEDGRHRAPVPPRAWLLQLVGLPRRSLPQELRDANRPHLPRRRLPLAPSPPSATATLVSHRPTRASFRPHAAHRRLRRRLVVPQLRRRGATRRTPQSRGRPSCAAR